MTPIQDAEEQPTAAVPVRDLIRPAVERAVTETGVEADRRDIDAITVAVINALRPGETPAALLTGILGFPTGQELLVTVWKDGTGTVATRDPQSGSWGFAYSLTAAP